MTRTTAALTRAFARLQTPSARANMQRASMSSTSWYHDEISSAVSPEVTPVTVDELKKLMAVPRGRQLVASEIDLQGRVRKDTHMSLAEQKEQNRVWMRLQRVLAQVDSKGSSPAATTDAYAAAFHALSRANMPYESMETLLGHMQGQGIPVSTTIYVAMLRRARGNAIVQVLRKSKANRAAAALLDGAVHDLLPTEVQSLHYHAYDAFIATIHAKYMESTSTPFSLETYQPLFAAIVRALPPLDPKLMERTIPSERLDKLAVASIRAPAACGLADVVLDRLDSLRDEYAGRGAVVPPVVFATALECFSSLVHGLSHVPRVTLETLCETVPVLASPRVQAMRRIERAMQTPFSAAMRAVDGMTETSTSDEAGEALYAKLNLASHYLKFMEKRVRGARAAQARAVAAHDAMGAADAVVADVYDMYLAAHGDDALPLRVALLNQYFVTASRLDRRIERNASFQDELVFRIFRVLDDVAANMTDDAQETQVLACLHHAFRALVVLLRVSEATMVLDMKETLFPHVPRSVDEYDHLITTLCTSRHTRMDKLLQVLQRMHNGGLAPSPRTIHSIVTFRMQQLTRSRKSNSRRKLVAPKMHRRMARKFADWDVPATSHLEHHPLQFCLAKDSDVHVSDVVDFLIDWHNMTGVVPYGRTIVSVCDFCKVDGHAPKPDLHELRRLVLWAQTLPLEPATQVYLDTLALE
ncbi:Aste57867_21205 [Aphanomyces stellatus]|uniref:Aste57867_21205 protein n=1 Tax=Aphanomyces stellatus TaxID=120398 RepID=A0A485LHM0_9STRA|nr:hypothetical protein As57867_021137 [Aphanomyces stellatus]VFT97878.1 Aste57867_21205 [Aphanomyces stellatus]